jgi:hypothetical protein
MIAKSAVEAMRAAAAAIADEARANYGVISVGPAFIAASPFGLRYSAITIVPVRGEQDFVSHDVILEAADNDPMLAAVYRMALVIALEEFFGRVQIFGNELTIAKYCQKEWPSERADQAVSEVVRRAGSTNVALQQTNPWRRAMRSVFLGVFLEAVGARYLSCQHQSPARAQ